MTLLIMRYPSILLIGPEQDAYHFVFQEIQKTLSCKGCSTCYRCKQIMKGKDFSLCVIAPEERYTLEVLEPINTLSQHARDSNDPFFFIITKADLLNASCANSLLKIVEEPPVGYHFIFLTMRPNLVLPTIRSRSIAHYVNTTKNILPCAPITTYFTKIDNGNVLTFSKEISTCTMNENECLIQIDYLLEYWIQHYKKLLQTESQTQQHHLAIKKTGAIIDLCIQTLHNPPQPGSAKIFWKNFYLQKQKACNP